MACHFSPKGIFFFTLVRGNWKYRDETFRDITNWVFLTPPRKLWKTRSLARKQTKTSQVFFTGANSPRWLNYIFSTPYKVYKSPGQYNEDLKTFIERLWKTWSQSPLRSSLPICRLSGMHLHPTAVLHHISTYTAHPRKHGYSSIFHSFLGMITESKHLFTRVQICRLNWYVLHGIKSQVHRWYMLCVMYRIVSSHDAKYRDLSVASRSIICTSRRLRQIIIDLRDTDKSRYFAIAEFNNCFIIRSPSLFFNEYFREAKLSAIFHARAIARRRIRKAWCRLRMSRKLFAAKHSWMMSRPLFVGSYLQVTWWAFGQWKGRKICIEW